MRRDAGFTLVEVMVSMLIGTVGLLGTIAVQQSITSAAKNANDAAVAMRLASQKLEELSSRDTNTTQLADQRIGLAPLAALGKWLPLDSGLSSVPEYVDAEGNFPRDTNGVPLAPQPSEMGRYRWRRQWKVVDVGHLSPYVVSVIVTYSNDVGAPKTTRLDMERRKSW
ncbi:MAG TPA: prepilin-type N-terminal cleavage/methylation domain-containing protein [Polyangia bacterium]|jgi:prepilin-type N-terminal cleavage/methylation domain-containing protein